VSLRDVERAMKVIMWFYSNSKLIQPVMEDDDNASDDEDSDSSEEPSEDESAEEDIQETEQVEQVRLLKV
jgi:hypothetical protein